MKTPPFEGGCLCGGTRYALDEALTTLNDCHCLDCRRSSGAPYVSWGTVSRKRMRLIRGDLRHIPHASRVRSFAACCGTHLFFAETPESETIDVTVASLDDPLPWGPTFTIWTEDKLPWVVLDEKRPTYPRSRKS